MMQVLKDIGGVELPESLIKLGGEGHEVTRPAAATNGAPSRCARRSRGESVTRRRQLFSSVMA